MPELVSEAEDATPEHNPLGGAPAPPKPVGVRPPKQPKCVNRFGKGVKFDMRDYCTDCCKHYTTLTGDANIKLASTPFPPDGSISKNDYESRGDLDKYACSLVMKCLWVGRLARPDLK